MFHFWFILGAFLFGVFVGLVMSCLPQVCVRSSAGGRRRRCTHAPPRKRKTDIQESATDAWSCGQQNARTLRVARVEQGRGAWAGHASPWGVGSARHAFSIALGRLVKVGARERARGKQKLRARETREKKESRGGVWGETVHQALRRIGGAGQQTGGRERREEDLRGPTGERNPTVAVGRADRKQEGKAERPIIVVVDEGRWQ